MFETGYETLLCFVIYELLTKSHVFIPGPESCYRITKETSLFLDTSFTFLIAVYDFQKFSLVVYRNLIQINK